MTEFKGHDGGYLIVDKAVPIGVLGGSGVTGGIFIRVGSVNDEYGTTTRFELDLAPAIAAAVLEAAGWEVPDTVNVLVPHAGAYSAREADAMQRDLMVHLHLIPAVREFHAKPRVSDDQVRDVRLEAKRTGHDITDWAIRTSLQAALDSGVLQVPADPTNEEGDR